MRSSNWFAAFLTCAVIGVAVGYLIVLLLRPGLLPPFLRLGGLTAPVTVMFLGTDVVYSSNKRMLIADPASFQGRSDTMMLVRFDPVRNSLCVLSIPRDTEVTIPGYRGIQKINGANAFGGPQLAAQTIWGFLGLSVDHYVVLNVHGLMEIIDDVGGIDVDIPKRMHYVDNSAKLNINLDPGRHHLDGVQAMGFVRFRHDALGDIGRVQRQQLFLNALEAKAMDPAAWAKIPQLLATAKNYVLTDMEDGQLLRLAAFARAVPKENQFMIMLPGHFSGTGNWAADDADVKTVVARFAGQVVASSSRDAIRITIENATADPNQGRNLLKYLSSRGYNVVGYKAKSEAFGNALATTRIIAQKGNTEDAEMIKRDLSNTGDIVTASIGDIQSSITIVAGSDLSFLNGAAGNDRLAPIKHKHGHRRPG